MGETALEKEIKRRNDGTRPGDREKTYVGLIDLRAAYDRVDRNKLLQIMADSPIRKEVTTAVAKIMNSTGFAIDSDGTKTTTIKTAIGV